MRGLQGLRRWRGLLGLWREVRGLRREVLETRAELERIAAALEYRNAQEWPQPSTVVLGEAGLTEVTYVDDREQYALMEIEARLTRATGRPPSEEEIQVEYDRLFHTEAEAEADGHVGHSAARS